MRSTRRSHDNTSPRPIGQSFWLLSTMAIAAIVVMAMGDALPASGGSADGPTYSSQQLLDLANGAATTTAPETADPAAPSLRTTPTSTAPSGSPSTSSSVPTEASTTSSPASITSTAPTTTENTTDSSATNGATNGATAEPTGYEARGQAALDAISYPWQELLPRWTITFLPEKSGLYGLTKVPDERIEIYVRDNQSLELLAHVIAHELGHAVDVTLNDGRERRLWEEARGLDSPWWPVSGATDFSTGAGDFAESFAAWQVGDQSFRSELSGAPNPEQIALLAQLAAG